VVRSNIVGVMAFDLRAVFDMVSAEQLGPLLKALGITGRLLQWFSCYRTGGKQCTVCDGTTSSMIDVLYGVRQGSILGPILFIILVSGMAKYLGIGDQENMVYEDNSNVWQAGKNVKEVIRKLTASWTTHEVWVS
jgi:hypothetical protein